MKFISLLALLPFGAIALKRGVISTPYAPSAIGPYSQAITLTYASGETLIQAAGQIGLDPTTGSLVEGGVKAEAERAMENIKAIMEAAGATMDEIVECTVLMTDLAEYGELNDVYARYFEED
ncbi:hypothetical protein TrRE_jg3343, partial [Triparma retinervis]